MALVKVRYKGLSDTREITKEQLADVGVGVDGDLVWHAGNRHTVHVENPSDALLEVLKNEGNMQVEEVDAKDGKEVKVIVKCNVTDDTGLKVVDKSDK